jgi:hypothetical protein
MNQGVLGPPGLERKGRREGGKEGRERERGRETNLATYVFQDLSQNPV